MIAGGLFVADEITYSCRSMYCFSKTSTIVTAFVLSSDDIVHVCLRHGVGLAREQVWLDDETEW